MSSRDVFAVVSFNVFGQSCVVREPMWTKIAFMDEYWDHASWPMPHIVQYRLQLRKSSSKAASYACAVVNTYDLGIEDIFGSYENAAHGQ